SANHLFRLVQNGHPRFLRLAHESERSASAIQAELAFVRHVASMGLATAQPLPSLNGRLVEEVSDQGQRYSAVLFEGLQGDQLELDALDEAGYRTWGHALGTLHRASQTFPVRRERSNWRDQIESALRDLPPDEPAVARVLQAGLDWLGTLTIPDQDYGLIHGDFELDNLIWDGDQPQALDFDDATYAWYALDFAAALQDVWLGGEMTPTQQKERIGWFLEGYATARPLPEGLREALPRLLTLTLALKIARLLRAYATTNDDDVQPAWLARMRARHQRWLPAKRASLVWK
ncbi:MAG TPA: phosphotransferase, partial [Ktedonobacterales bacterium]